MLSFTHTHAYTRDKPILTINMIASTAQALTKDGPKRHRDSGAFFDDPGSRSSLETAPHHSLSSPRMHARSDTKRKGRLCYPTEQVPVSPKPKTEFELQYDLILHSPRQSKAASRSPTQLLNNRLNPSPTTKAITRVFTPPQPMVNGCILPGPTVRMEAFTRKEVCARTERGRPSWWCKADGVVILDGVEMRGNGEMGFRTRSSKGLTVARRNGAVERSEERRVGKECPV